MNKKFSLLLLSLAILLVIPFTALGIGFPHDNTQAVGCTNCHNATASLAANLFNNMCTSCHKPGSANVKVTSQFYQTDAANIYNRFNGYSAGAIPAGKLKYTSHNWAGSVVAPEAGASKPTDAKMNISTLGTTLSCARCHNVHGYKSSSINSSPFLRSLNDNDEMCRDCHRKRDTSSHLLGSHPVNFRYTSATSKAVTKSADYFNPPRNANPGNPTSAMKLVNGKIMCTSCHAIHYADSNSGTVDSRSTWANLSSSRGMLLRTDTFGKTDDVTSVNICTNCHNKPNHQAYPGSKTNAKPIQCVDCHSGHVEYLKPEDVALGGDDAKPNVYLLRRYMNYSAGVRLDSYRRKAFLTSTSSTNAVWKKGDGTAICEACHALPATVSDHASASVTKVSDCAPCHAGTGKHATAPPVGCSGCHGYPPQHSTGVLNSGGYAVDGAKSYNTSGVYKNESTAGHPTHAAGKPYSYSCVQCHKNNIHDTGSFQDVFVTGDKTGMLAGTASTFAGSATISTCSNVYCHSYGMATLTKAKSIEWKAGARGSIVKPGDDRCVSCHNGVNSTYNNMSTNAHFRHVSKYTATGKNISCAVCHAATVSSNSALSNIANHVNGSRDVSFGAGLGSGTSWNGTNCSASYCHSNGANIYATPKWSDRTTGKCGSCHGTTATTPQLTSNRHFTHFSSVYGPKLNAQGTPIACQNCHTFTGELESTHVDGTIQKISSCTPCHPAATTYTWTVSTRLVCSDCHSGTIRSAIGGITAPFKPLSTIQNHGHFTTGFLDNSGAAITCTSCHDPNSRHITGVPGSVGRLINGYQSNNNVPWGTGDNQICTYCHAPGKSAAAKVRLTHVRSPAEASGGTPTMLCAMCHDVHGAAGNDHMVTAMLNYSTNVYTSISYTSRTSAPYTFIQTSGPYRGICQACHTKTNHFRRGKAESDAGTGWNAPGINHSSFTTSVNCLSCHKHNFGSYAFSKEGGTCDACHGYPPAPKSFVKGVSNYNNSRMEDYSGAGGSHIVSGHVPKSADPTKAFILCDSCHNENDHNMSGNFTKSAQIKVSVSSRLRFNQSIQPKYSSNKVDGAGHLPGKCSNVSCHFQKSPKWGNKP